MVTVRRFGTWPAAGVSHDGRRWRGVVLGGGGGLGGVWQRAEGAADRRRGGGGAGPRLRGAPPPRALSPARSAGPKRRVNGRLLHVEILHGRPLVRRASPGRGCAGTPPGKPLDPRTLAGCDPCRGLPAAGRWDAGSRPGHLLVARATSRGGRNDCDRAAAAPRASRRGGSRLSMGDLGGVRRAAAGGADAASRLGPDHDNRLDAGHSDGNAPVGSVYWQLRQYTTQPAGSDAASRLGQLPLTRPAIRSESDPSQRV